MSTQSTALSSARPRPVSTDGVRARLASLTLLDKHAALFPPRADLRPALRALRHDLTEVRVLGPDGQVMDVYEKLMAEPRLRPAQKQRIFRVLAEVRDAYLRVDNAEPPGSRDKGYQIVNWKHTRAEIDQVLEAAKLARLQPQQIEDAILGSIFSDAVKVPGNFIVHNIDGSAAAAHVLARYFDPAVGRNLVRIAAIATLIREHQVSPPGFMGGIARTLITKKLGTPSAEQDATLASIVAKISRPFAAPLVFDEGAAIDFNAAERELLAVVDVHEWRVPHPRTHWYGPSRAVIDGDCLINYACPDGWAKIAAIRGPDTQPFFEDPTIFDSLHSAKKSFDDALSVMSEPAHALAEAGLARTRRAIRTIRDKMRVWLASQPWLPVNPDGTIPFWNAPLKYPRLSRLSRLEEDQFRFAKQIRARVVELLREEQGRY
jgi:hypothetical protein